MSQLTLLVLAAGAGSRFGGLKQMAVVGPAGESILDYTVFDAVRAGFTRVVFVIRRDFETAFRRAIAVRIRDCEVDFAFQEIDDLPAGYRPPPGRRKPWGTAHAVWCARGLLNGPFAVVNADDFYGRQSLAALAEFFQASVEPNGALSLAMVGFRLANTISAHGAVSRGICRVGSDGALQRIVERTDIRAGDVGAGGKYSGDEVVSMNCWAFPAAVLPEFGSALERFLFFRGAEPDAEFGLPEVVGGLMNSSRAKVRVLPTDARWFGVTYRDDHAGVVGAIAQLIESGEYPATMEARR